MDYDKDEDALIAINGQTGKIVGNIPVDKKENDSIRDHSLYSELADPVGDRNGFSHCAVDGRVFEKQE